MFKWRKGFWGNDSNRRSINEVMTQLWYVNKYMKEESEFTIGLHCMCSLIWATGAITWSTFLCSRYSILLHKLMIFEPLLKLLNSLSFAMLIFYRSESVPYILHLCYSSSFILARCSLYMTLVLISRGFGITRLQLDRVEVTVLSIIMGILYLSYSSYMIENDRLIALIIIMQLAIMMLIFRFTVDNIFLFRSLLESYDAEINTPVIQQSILHRIRILQQFLILSFVYIGTHLFIVIVFSLILDPIILSIPNDYSDFILSMLDETLEIVVIFYIYYILRPGALATSRELFSLRVNIHQDTHIPFYQALPNAPTSSDLAVVYRTFPEKENRSYMLIGTLEGREEFTDQTYAHLRQPLLE